MRHQTILALVFSAVALAAPAPIGMITATGNFELEGSRVWGNSTLFEGARVQTTDASSELALSNGVKVQLSTASQARVWKGRLELERGASQVTSKTAFQVSAAGMAVEGSRYRVAIGKDARMQVVALTGDARVMDARGTLLAAVPAGKTMSFAIQRPPALATSAMMPAAAAGAPTPGAPAPGGGQQSGNTPPPSGFQKMTAKDWLIIGGISGGIGAGIAVAATRDSTSD